MTGKLGEFISTNGGPLLLLPERLLAYWDGINPPKNGRKIEATFRWNGQAEATDYDRACDVWGYIGVIPVGDGEGLVLGDDQMSTAWYEVTPESGMLVRWNYAESEDDIREALEYLPEDLVWKEEGQITFKTSPLALLDSAEPGYDPLYAMPINLASGSYSIKTNIYEPDPHLSLVLHRLDPLI